MHERVSWLDGFVKWFFNASPVWVDERQLEIEREVEGGPLNRRLPGSDRRHGPQDPADGFDRSSRS